MTRIYAFLFTFISQFGSKRGAVAEGLVQQRLTVHAAEQPACKASARRHGIKPNVIANGKKSDMKQLNIKVALAMSLISMFLLTKWWFALPVDGPDNLYWGFPFAFMGKGFHTSMSYQFFILEFIASFAAYFSFWVILSLSINKWIPNFKMPSIVSKTILSLALLLCIGFVGLISISNPIFHFERPYEWKILETGAVFIWQDTPRPERSDSFNK